MDFAKYINTPKNTTIDNPLTTTLKLTRGRLSGGFLFFPSGPAGTLHILARIGIHQILPFNTGENFRLDDCVISFSLGIDLVEAPFYVDLVTWNDSTLYDHALTISFALQPKSKKNKNIAILSAVESLCKGYHKK